MGQILLGQNGYNMVYDRLDDFGYYFDWTITYGRIYKKTEDPKTIYIKTDYLPNFVNILLPNLKSEFILISACSDYSPEVNFNNEYNTIINHPLLKHWYMNSMRKKTEKSSGLPCGIASGDFWKDCTPDEVYDLLMKIRNQVNAEEKIEKVFCCFRNRDWNVCGEDMIIRPKILELIKGRTDIFDFYDQDSLDFESFVTTMSKYKYALCPHGNGMDPNPTSMLSLMVYTTPVVYSTPHARSIFEDTDSVIFFDSFEEVLDKSIYKTVPHVEFEWMTNKYWADKINSHLSK